VACGIVSESVARFRYCPWHVELLLSLSQDLGTVRVSQADGHNLHMRSDIYRYASLNDGDTF